MKDVNSTIRKMEWGEEPEFFGPRHVFRENMILKHLEKRTARGARVLDAGSGSGTLSLRIGRAGYQVLGIDASDAFVSHAEEKSRQSRLNDAVAFRKMDLLNPDLKTASFDAVVSGEVLEHLEHDDQAVQTYYKVLKQGGYCIVTVPAHPHLWSPVDEWAGHVRRYTRDALETMFRKKGFIIDRCSYWGFPLVRLYDRMIYRPMVYGKIKHPGKTDSRPGSVFSGWQKSRGLHGFISLLFTFDHLFSRLPFGIGLLLVARKK